MSNVKLHMFLLIHIFIVFIPLYLCNYLIEKGILTMTFAFGNIYSCRMHNESSQKKKKKKSVLIVSN